MTKARFEEAKACELGKVSSMSQEKSDPPENSTKTPATEQRSHKNVECHNCGRRGHIARYCHYSQQQEEEEAKGKLPQKSTQMATVVPKEERIVSLKSQLQKAE